MMNNSMSTREYILFGILDQLLVLADKGCDAASLASRLDVEVADIEGGLTHLRGRGLIQEKQLRLTMSGLSAASALAAARRRRSLAA